jgi:hypothetical protein
MHRLNGLSRFVSAPLGVLAGLGLLAGLGIASGACGSNKPAVTGTSEGDGGDTGDGGESASGDTDGGAEKKDECVGFDIANLEDMLTKSSCEESNVKPDSIQPVDLKGKLEVTLSASPMKSAPGGKVDLLVTFANKSKDPLILHFRIDPVARFETEVYEQKKGKRADLPTGPAPAPPKGQSQPPASEVKSARITLAPNGTARARVPWDAVKMKWAPEKVRGTPSERGFPRGPAGPLPKGKYNVKVQTPLIGVSEGVDHDMSSPKVEIEIGG